MAGRCLVCPHSQKQEIAGLLKILHAQSLDIRRAMLIAATASLACADNDVERTWLWLDLLMIALARYDPEGFEAKMNSFGCKYQSYFARRYYAHEKKEGQADGWVEGRAQGRAEAGVWAGTFGVRWQEAKPDHAIRRKMTEHKAAKEPQ